MKHSSSALLSAVECVAPPGRVLAIGTDSDFQNQARLAGFQVIAHCPEDETPSQVPLPNADFIICVFRDADEPKAQSQALTEILRSVAPKLLFVWLTPLAVGSSSVDVLADHWAATLKIHGLRPLTSIWRRQKLADGTYLLCFESTSWSEPKDGQARRAQEKTILPTVLARYHLAARFIAPGEAVVDLACGTGEGAAVLADASFATSVLGLHDSADAISLAARAFAAPNLQFATTPQSEMAHLVPKEHADVVVFLNEYLQADQVFDQLKLAKIELRPGGRLVLAVDARDAVGGSRHAWAEFEKNLPDSFLIGARFLQVGAQLTRMSLQAAHDGPADAWVAVVHRDPFDVDLPYSDNLASFVDGGGHAADRALGFEQPWLVPALVRHKTRPKDDEALVQLAHSVAKHASPESVDIAAALCVEGYQALEKPPEKFEVDNLFGRMETWLKSGSDRSPAHVRWSVSLGFVKARLHLLYDDIDAALRCFDACLSAPFMMFDATLATKTTQAGNEAARLALCLGNLEKARSYWQAVVDAAAKALSGASYATGRTPPPYLFGELAEVAAQADWAARCLTYVQRPEDYARLKRLSKSVADSEITASTTTQTISANSQIALRAARLEHQNQWSSITRLASERICVLHPSPVSRVQAPRLILSAVCVFDACRLHIKVATPNPAPENAGARLKVVCEHPDGAVWRTECNLPPHARETLAIELGKTDGENHKPNVITIDVFRASETASHQASAVHLSGFWIAP